MPIARDTLEKRAIREGVKASKKRHHVISKDELLSLRVQMLRPALRIALVVLGIALITCCALAWPSESTAARVIEGVSGLLLVLFGTFGIRRTLSNILDSYDSINLVESVLEAVGDAVSSIDL